MGVSFTAGGNVSVGRDVTISSQEGHQEGSSKEAHKDDNAQIAALLSTIVDTLEVNKQEAIAAQIKENIPKAGSPASVHLCNLITAAAALVGELRPLAGTVLAFFKKPQ